MKSIFSNPTKLAMAALSAVAATMTCAQAQNPFRLVLVVDESNSAEQIHTGLANQSSTILQTLRNETMPNGFEIAVVGFAQNVGENRNPRRNLPILYQSCSNQETDFLIAIGRLQLFGGNTPGFDTIHEIATNNINPNNENCCPSSPLFGNGPVCDDLLDCNGFCVLMLTDSQVVGNLGGNTAETNIADLLAVGGVFSIIGNDRARREYGVIANETGGGIYQLGQFDIDITQAIVDCVRAVTPKPTEAPTSSPTEAPTQAPSCPPIKKPRGKRAKKGTKKNTNPSGRRDRNNLANGWKRKKGKRGLYVSSPVPTVCPEEHGH